MSINETHAGYLIMRLSGVIHASDGAKDQDGESRTAETADRHRETDTGGGTGSRVYVSELMRDTQSL